MEFGELKQLYQKLLGVHLRHLLGIGSLIQMDDGEINKLLFYASSLALYDRTHKVHDLGYSHEVSYNIVTRLHELNKDNNGSPIHSIAAHLLARIGNFPQRELLKKYDGHLLGPLFSLEVQTRSLANGVAIAGQHLILTDFQKDIFEKLTDNKNDQKKVLSISAPTSAGKSYSILCYLTEYLNSPVKRRIIYVVPTRALIRQVSASLRTKLRRDGAELAYVTSVSEYDEEFEKENVIYVLTQERLLSILKNYPEFVPDLLIVDEAQEFGSRSRGILLQSAVEYSIKRSGELAVVFISPPLNNPEVFSNVLRNSESQDNTVTEKSSPVGQNIILLRPVNRKPKVVDVNLLTPAGELSIGAQPVPFNFRGPACIAEVAAHFSHEDEVSIVYCDRPYMAERTARKLSEKLDDLDDATLTEFSKFIRDEVHQDHPLAAYILKGIAFHYGNLPSIVRSRIEQLAENRKLRFICCTSTLIQGVNLPARNMFIQNPHKGVGKPMAPADFWNLAGRVGRMAKEFHGEVYCLYSTKWDRDVILEDKEYIVEPAFEGALLRRASEIRDYADAINAASENKATSEYEYAFSKIYSDFFLNEIALDDMELVTDKNKADLTELMNICKGIRKGSVLTKDIFQRNPGINPRNIENLSSELMLEPKLNSVLPMYPYTDGGFERNREIFGILERIFFKTNTQSYMYFSWLAHQWMTGETFSKLLAGKIQRAPEDKVVAAGDEGYEEFISTCARELMEDIDSTLRYRYVKYLSCYNDVLERVLDLREEHDLKSQVAPLQNYIEFGGCDEILINLIGYGLSRSSAIRVKAVLRRLKIHSFTKREIAGVLKVVYERGSGLPQTTLLEIAAVIGA